MFHSIYNNLSIYYSIVSQTFVKVQKFKSEEEEKQIKTTLKT